MTDRELLELAAKAAGLKNYQWSEKITDYDSPHHGSPALYPSSIDGQCDSWNPLTDDGDALRLAVTLGLQVLHFATVTTVKPLYAYWGCDERHDGDPYAATRRAIVRAAAEVGKQM